MSSLVVEIFDSDERARGAAARLRETGFADDSVLTVSASGAGSVADALIAGRWMAHAAGFYADRVRQGRTLVAVDAPFGRADLARQILIDAGSVDRDLVVPMDPEREAWGKGAPFSEAMGWRVLSRNDPTPFSTTFGFSVLSRCRFFLTRGLASSGWFPSRIFGPLLGGRTPMRSSIGMPLLSSRAAPLSGMFGLPLLSSRPPRADLEPWSRQAAPFSAMLGLPVLTRRQ